MDTRPSKEMHLGPGINRPGEKRMLPWQLRSAMAGRTIHSTQPKEKPAKYVKDATGKLRRVKQ